MAALAPVAGGRPVNGADGGATDGHAEQLEGRVEQLQRRCDVLARKLEHMAARLDDGGQAAVVTVLARDRAFSVPRSLLAQAHGTLLGAMFSGRWEGNLTRDDQQRVVLPVHPGCFELLLEYLLRRSMEADPPHTPLPPVPPDLEYAWQNLVRFFDLQYYITPLFFVPMTWGYAGPDTQLAGLTATHVGEEERDSIAVTSTELQPGHYQALNLCGFTTPGENWVFVGVGGPPDSPDPGPGLAMGHTAPGTYGVGLFDHDVTSSMVIDGCEVQFRLPWGVSREGDTVLLHRSPDSLVLEVFSARCSKHKLAMRADKAAGWWVAACMCYAGSAVQLAEPTARHVELMRGAKPVPC